ncbi:Hsp70 family protein, partial [Rothia kristinae]
SKDAEADAEADKQRREAQDRRNTGENSAYHIEELLEGNEDKLPEDVKSEVQADVDDLKKALEGEDDDAVKSACEKLQSSQTKLGEAIYAHAQAGEGAADAGAANADATEDDVGDAEGVDDEDEKKEGIGLRTPPRTR